MAKLNVVDELEFVSGSASRTGLRASKFLSAEVFALIIGMAVGKAVELEPIKDGEKEPNLKRQAQVTRDRIAMSLGRAKRSDLPEYIVGVTKNGVGIKKVAEIRKPTEAELAVVGELVAGGEAENALIAIGYKKAA